MVGEFDFDVIREDGGAGEDSIHLDVHVAVNFTFYREFMGSPAVHVSAGPEFTRVGVAVARITPDQLRALAGELVALAGRIDAANDGSGPPPA